MFEKESTLERAGKEVRRGVTTYRDYTRYQRQTQRTGHRLTEKLTEVKFKAKERGYCISLSLPTPQTHTHTHTHTHTPFGVLWSLLC
jgi:hypothetical protein